MSDQYDIETEFTDRPCHPLQRLLWDLGACDEAVAFVGDHDTLQQAWDDCDQPSWILWYAARVAGATQLLRDAACDLAYGLIADSTRRYNAAIDAAVDAQPGQIHKAMLAANEVRKREFAQICVELRARFYPHPPEAQ